MKKKTASPKGTKGASAPKKTAKKLDLPPWADALREAAVMDLKWLTSKEADATRKSWLEIWNQVPYDDAFHARCRARLDRCIPVATGPTRRRRLSGRPAELTLVYDPAAPDDVWVSLCDAMPSMVWPAADPKPARFLESLRPYLVDEPIAVAKLPCVYRVAKPLGEQRREVVEQSIEYVEMWLDDAAWGSRHDEDPWPQGKPLSYLQQAAHRRHALEEVQSRFSTISYRTLWSRSVLKVEQHPYGLCVFELRYAPVTGTRDRGGFDEETAGRFPRDLPLDLAASLLRGETIHEAAARESVANPGCRPIDHVLLAALAPSEVSTEKALREAAARYAGNPEALLAIAEIAQQYEHRALLYELGMGELREKLEKTLRPIEAHGTEAAS